jgi:2,3-bisphosphoglycerate-dependent phosphoglycerate mutase
VRAVRSRPREGRLILLRHGESTWNAEQRFTGWADPPLTERGRAEATAAGRALARTGLQPQWLVTSVLTRATETTDLVIAGLGGRPPVAQDWRFNERHYGVLEGMSHEAGRRRWGERRVTAWRRGWDDRPPLLDPCDPRHPCHDPRYEHAPGVPAGESLADCLERQLSSPIAAEATARVVAGERVLLVGHGNSLRAFVSHLEGIPPAEVPGLLIPTGEPLVYAFRNQWRRLDVALGVQGTWTGP